MILDYEDGRLMAKWLDVETGLEQLFTLPEASLLPIAQASGRRLDLRALQLGAGP